MNILEAILPFAVIVASIIYAKAKEREKAKQKAQYIAQVKA